MSRILNGVVRGRALLITGFTFVELLIVVSIISMLAAIAMPAYRDYELRAQVTEALSFLGDSKIAVDEFYSRWGRMPVDNAEAGLRSADVMRGKYVRSVTVSGGVIVATMDLGFELAGDAMLHRTLTFRPWLNAASPSAPIFWSCGESEPVEPGDYHVIGELAAAKLEARLLPTACRAQVKH
jgi:type IV pilus assembly protein PilA